MTIEINPIPAFNDNYIWAIHNNKNVVIVDPGDGDKVTSFLHQNQLTLTAILITHHHHDHTGGLVDLQDQWLCPVYAPVDSRIPGKLTHVHHKDQVNVDPLDLTLNVLETPGHTLTHVVYHDEERLFCGDTLFSLGCGRMFEGTPKQFTRSLKLLKELSSSIEIFCAHEYTLANGQFAKQLMQNNNQLEIYLKKIKARRTKNLPSLPSTLALEKTINPFLNLTNEHIIETLEHHTSSTIQSEEHAFAVMREWKDQF